MSVVKEANAEPEVRTVTFEEELARSGSLVYRTVGRSMLPLLRQGRDLFVVEKRGPGRLKAGDVVLYRRPPDKYVLHRIVEVREKDYVILGDNCVNREYGITDDDMPNFLDATDALGAAYCHYMQMGRPEPKVHYKGWKDFVNKNQQRVCKQP